MKIVLVVNTHSNYHRQNVAVDSWRHLKKVFPGIVEIVNLQFADEEVGFVNHYPDFDTRFVLTRSSKDLVQNPTKKLPIFGDIFAEGLKQDCNFFLMGNNDVVIMPKLIQYIIDNNPTALSCSRLDIQNVESFQQILSQQVQPTRWEPAGHDFWAFNKQWAEVYKEYFLRDYIVGKWLYDVIVAGYIKLFGNNAPFMNDYPVCCFHLSHGTSAVTDPCPEKDWNENLMKSSVMDTLVNNIMFVHLKKNLIRRKPWGAFLELAPNEKRIEKDFFDILNVVNPIHSIMPDNTML